MAMMVTLCADWYAMCPTEGCNRKILFFSGSEGAFMSEEKRFLADDTLTPKCPLHGVFEVMAQDFRSGLAECESETF
jgi:hypothetical protein